MKQLIAITILSLGLTPQAFADYNCSGENGEQLYIHYRHVSKLVDAPPKFVGATLKINDVAIDFSPDGHSQNGAYNLKDAEGNHASLKISKQTFYGNRCGRCGDDFPPSEIVNAKLTYLESEMNFTCQ